MTTRSGLLILFWSLLIGSILPNLLSFMLTLILPILGEPVGAANYLPWIKWVHPISQLTALVGVVVVILDKRKEMPLLVSLG